MSLDFILFDVGKNTGQRFEICSFNITHNLAQMADAAGIYDALWSPPEGCCAEQLIDDIKSGLSRLLADPEKFRIYNPKNGWGSAGDLVSFINDVLSACRENPKAMVSVSR